MLSRSALSAVRQCGGSFVRLLTTAPVASRVVSRAVQPFSRCFCAAPHPAESFLSGSSVVFMEEVYRNWKSDPSSVAPSWQKYFSMLEAGKAPGSYVPQTVQVSSSALSGASVASSDAGRLSQLIEAYRNKGHLAASTDPLHLMKTNKVKELDYKHYGFTEADLDKPMSIPSEYAFLQSLGPNPRLRDVISKLQTVHASSVGLEVQHLLNTEERQWILSRFEEELQLSKKEKLHLLDRVAYAVEFENFCKDHFRTTKRFGLEGNEALIPGIKSFIDRLTELGADTVAIGMPHRGRLNVLANVIRKPLQHIFQEFAGIKETSVPTDPNRAEWYSQGDVKYHLGTSYDRTYDDGRKIHLSVSANPSHLETVDPVILGRTAAKQHFRNDTDKSKIVSVLMHGDAAYSGQGVVYETMQMSQVPNYGVGGTVHIVVNNQVGFTTDPENGRSTHYCTDIAKGFDLPIFHVNGEDVEAVHRVFRIMAEYRQRFHKDIVVDLIGFRRHGHNEVDSPYFTQPTMYKEVDKHPSVLEVYQSKLISSGVLTTDEAASIHKEVQKVLQDAYDSRDSYKSTKSEWLSMNWKGFKSPTQLSPIRKTGMDLDVLKKLGTAVATTPDSFKLHPNIKKIYDQRLAMITSGENIDWGMAETMAFGSLLIEGHHVRLSGQDVQRGTFSHRHATVHDQNTNALYTPLEHLPSDLCPACPDKPAVFQACNSILSEYAVLGYELGYHPNQLVIWEAQFGDFANNAQVVIDNMLASGESKWLRQTGLTLLLPHGYDGQGAEHSSCRLERYLSLCDDDPDDVPNMEINHRKQIQNANWQIVNCTTPANFFHVLRRQLHREFRKPLIVASPKFLLKYRGCTSNISEFGPGTMFHRIYYEMHPEELVSYDKIKRVLFCSGKIYYELLNYRREKTIQDTAIIRLEQIAPFPFDRVADVFNRYPMAKFRWIQEEPKNMGAYSYVRPRFRTSGRVINGADIELSYIGRRAAASPATGYGKVHQAEQSSIIEQAFQ